MEEFYEAFSLTSNFPWSHTCDIESLKIILQIMNCFRPPATFLKSKKKKRHGSSDGSDVEIKITPPPSPENDEDGIQVGFCCKKIFC